MVKLISIERLSTFLSDLRNLFATITRVADIEGKIPTQASPINQLADKNFVNSSIQTATATFRGIMDCWCALGALGSAPDNNDYAVLKRCNDYIDKFDDDPDEPHYTGDIFGYGGIVYRVVTDFEGSFDETKCEKIGEFALYGGEEPDEVMGVQRYYSYSIEGKTYFRIADWDTENPDGLSPSDPSWIPANWVLIEGASWAVDTPLATWRWKYTRPSGSGVYAWEAEYKINDAPLTAAQLAALNSDITKSLTTKLQGLPSKPVDTAAQSLSSAEKAQARMNIGAGTSSFSGDYNDLTNKPDLSVAVQPFTNPVGPWRPDPCFWKADDGCFYVKGTGSLNTVLRTRDFVHYEDTGRTFLSASAVAWLNEHYGHAATDDAGYLLKPHHWAPQVLKIGDNWVLYMAIVERTGTKAAPVDGTAHIVAFTSRTPYGDFSNPVTIVSDNEVKASATSSTKWNNVIDPFVYCDPDDNKLYLIAGSSYAIRRAKLAADGLSLEEGTFAQHIAGQSVNTSPNRATVYEGAYLYKHIHNGTTYWYLFVSAGHYDQRDYCVRVGRSTKASGIVNNSYVNYVDKKGEVMRNGGSELLLSTESNESPFWGPGHVGGIFESSDGRTFMLYHCHDGNGSADRKLFIQELFWDANGWPYFGNEGHPVANGEVPMNIITGTTQILPGDSVYSKLATLEARIAELEQNS